VSSDTDDTPPRLFPAGKAKWDMVSPNPELQNHDHARQEPGNTNPTLPKKCSFFKRKKDVRVCVGTFGGNLVTV
jgi:hypothetical protein